MSRRPAWKIADRDRKRRQREHYAADVWVPRCWHICRSAWQVPCEKEQGHGGAHRARVNDMTIRWWGETDAEPVGETEF